ncbi:hypothetical protein LRS13_08835 [Svornostia abyssi]|uniref:SnoaL-like domain-containing protein n=1 Tax=Svornostia abyssi TaxID=2898438 RepID=A0ABY5PM19_9ACTN|nr:hypothetical protein LRS13_08835 [Parviterribacteraceae bacterium J379]
MSERRAPHAAGTHAARTPEELARAWAVAYAEQRDDDLVALAHPDIVLQPRRGQAEPEYHGVEGVRQWLSDIGADRPPFERLTSDTLDEHRAIAEASMGDMRLVAVFEARDGLLVRVAVYLSDRKMLERLGVI